MITAAQSRAARAFLNWSQPDLAHAAGTSVSAVRDFETGTRSPLLNSQNALQRALEEAGIVFLAEGDIAQGGAGVRLGRTLRDEGLAPDQLNAENDD